MISVEVKWGSPGLKNFVIFPLGGQAQKMSTATPLVVSKPVPPSFTVVPCITTVSTLLVAKLGSLLDGARPIPLIVLIVGMPARGSPCSSADIVLDFWKPLSVLTTCTDANPCPRGMVSGTTTVIIVEVWGFSC